MQRFWLPACRHLGPMQFFSISELHTFYLHFRYGRQFAFPLASHSLLPPYVQSSVLVCWLSFDQAGLSSLPTSASWRTYNQNTTLQPVICKFCKNSRLVSAVTTVAYKKVKIWNWIQCPARWPPQKAYIDGDSRTELIKFLTY